MPAIVDKLTVGKQYDKRRRLTDVDRQDILDSYAQGMAMRALARAYNVDRCTIRYIVRPEAVIQHKAWLASRGGWRHYYQKDKHREYTYKHRRYKEELLRNKLIGGGV